MKQWTHDELHALMDNSPKLKEKSDKAHASPQSNEEERERGKLQMMEIYAEAVDCSNVTTAQEFTREAFLCMKQGIGLDVILAEYSSKKLCHSPFGNDYLCFCNKEQGEAMNSDYMFSVTVYTKDNSKKCKENAKRELEKLGFRVLFVHRTRNYMTVRCSKSNFERVFGTTLKQVNIQGSSCIGCEAEAFINIPKELKKYVDNIVIAPLPIDYNFPS